MPDNPLLDRSSLPFQLPPFADLRDGHYLPAFELGMSQQLAEIDAIVANPETPSFANTVEAMERSGQLLQRARVAFFSVAASHATDPVREIQTAVMPLLAQHADAIALNRDLFARLRQVATDDPEEAWLLERYRLDFVRAGAELDEAGQSLLRRLNEELATLATAFSQNLLTASTASALVVDDAAQLDGLSSAEVRAAEDDGRYLLPLLNFTSQPALSRLTDRATRRRLYELSVNRAPENLRLAVRMASLRAERAALLGYPNHAAYTVADQTAKTTDAVEEMLGRLVGPTVANATREAAALSEQAGFGIEAWDWSFYAEQVRRARYDFDSSELRPYFELERVLADGVFHAATQLYGVTFARRGDLVGYHPDVRAYEVSNADGSPLGLFLLDPYARPTKRGGAWMNHLVAQSHLLDQRPVVMNNLNITRPAEGPTLLTHDEVATAFHEFGHALHGLFSDVRYPRVSGTSVPRDFVEYPSQVNEMWLTWPSVVQNFARHHETGERLPAALLDKMLAAEQYNQGFSTLEYLAAALLDWAWHTLAPGAVVEDAEAFERAALERAGVDFALVRPRYRTNYFAHIFSDGVAGYSAGYYSYIWSEVLDADSVEWFKANGGLTRDNGDRFRSTLLSVGGSRDVLAAFREFRGQDASIEPLLHRRGLQP